MSCENKSFFPIKSKKEKLISSLGFTLEFFYQAIS